jgi:hypothetical protein
MPSRKADAELDSLLGPRQPAGGCSVSSLLCARGRLAAAATAMWGGGCAPPACPATKVHAVPSAMQHTAFSKSPIPVNRSGCDGSGGVAARAFGSGQGQPQV